MPSHRCFTVESAPQELAICSLELASVNELGLELEFLVNADNEQLLEIPLPLDEYMSVCFLRRNGLYLYKLAVDDAVGTSPMCPVAAKSEPDFGIYFAEFAPHLKVPSRVLKVTGGTVN